MEDCEYAAPRCAPATARGSWDIAGARRGYNGGGGGGGGGVRTVGELYRGVGGGGARKGRGFRRPLRRLAAGGLFYTAVLAYAGFAAWQAFTGTAESEDDSLRVGGRSLLSGGGACGSAYDMWGGKKAIVDDKFYIAYLFGILYMFVGIAIICDDYFVGSLEAICEKLELPEDVAGATFMAAGSSAPELFTSLMSLITNAGNEIGISAIVGSAVFNVLVIIGGTAMLAGQILVLDWRPVVRDVLFYLTSIGTTLLFLYDGEVFWWEGLISTALYGVYIFTMYYNEQLMDWMTNTFDKSSATVAPAPSAKDGASFEINAQSPPRSPIVLVPPRELSVQDYVDSSMAIWHAPGGSKPLVGAAKAFGSGVYVVMMAKRWRRKALDMALPIMTTHGTSYLQSSGEADGKFNVEKARRSIDEDSTESGADDKDDGSDKASSKGSDSDDEEEEKGSPFQLPESLADAPMWALCLPWNIVFYCTVPDCTRKGWEGFYLLSFLGSITMIGAISYCMVEWANLIGCAVDAPLAIMGTQVLAAGTSIPDALSSVLVARQGMGDMAVANAIGSNVFDIWLGLGFPWMIMLPFRKGGKVKLDTTELYPNIGILVGVLVLYFTSLKFAKFKLGMKLGAVYCVAYLGFTMWNVIGVWYMRVYDK